MRYGAFFDDIGVKAKVTFSDECASDILQLINRKFFDFVVVATPVRSFSRAAPTFQTSLLPSGSQGVELQHDHQARQRGSRARFLTCCAAAFSQSVACVLLHPENIGSVTFTQPASIWDFAESRDFLDWKGTFAGAAYSCDLYSHEMPKPLRLLSNIDHLRNVVWEGWPELQEQGDRQVYWGPLPRNCRYKVPNSISTSMAKTPLRKGSRDGHRHAQRPETDISMHNIGPAPCPSTAPRAHAFLLLQQVLPLSFSLTSTSQVSSLDPRQFVSPPVLGCSDGWRWWPSKGSGSSSSPGKGLATEHQQGVTTTVRGWLHPGDAWDKPTPSESQVPSPGRDASSSCLNGSSCLRACRGRFFVDFRFPQVHPVRARCFQRSWQGRLYSPPSPQLRLETRRFYFPQGLGPRHGAPRTPSQVCTPAALGVAVR